MGCLVLRMLLCILRLMLLLLLAGLAQLQLHMLCLKSGNVYSITLLYCFYNSA